MLIYLLFLFKLVVDCAAVFPDGPTHGKKVVCYVQGWSSYRKDVGQFSIEDIEPSLCTNIIYAFALLDEKTNSIISGDPFQDLEENNGKAAYRRVTALKENYPHLKVSISLGGWVDGSAKYSVMAASRASRQTFIQSVLDFLKLHNFDGLDMHWKFPALRDGKPYDKANYVLLLKELKEAFIPHNYLLTAAFGALQSVIDAAYDLPKLNQHLDYMHLLAFYYHGAWEGTVGSNAPLIGFDQSDLNSLDSSLNYMINKGASPGKIILGLPFFGHTFELVDSKVESVEFGETSTKTVGFQGPYTAESGLMGYNEICMETSNKTTSWSHHWDARSATAFIRDKGRVVCYDSGRSIANKVKMAVDRGLAGLMLWALDMDDFRGLCDAEVGSYVDFETRFSELIKNSALPRVIRSLNLPTMGTAGPSDYYVTSHGQLSLLPPRPAPVTYRLLRTINTAASLAVQENRILDALSAAATDRGTGCLQEIAFSHNADNCPTHGKKVVCYVQGWSSYRKDVGQFIIEDIEPSLCTNIIYAFALLDEKTNSIISGDVWQDLDINNGKAAYRRVTALKENYPHLKVSISLGGWTDGSAKYSAMAASRASRQTFIQSVLEFLKLHNFDGLDMHWKFPTLRDGKPYDKTNYVLLLKELKEAFVPNNYLLTAAFGALQSVMEVAYDLLKLNQHLDYMHLLAFYYHGAWEGTVGSNAPLRGQNNTSSLESSLNYMISNGVSPGKIILGLPTFGHTFELVEPEVERVEFMRTSSKHVGFQGPYTTESGLMGYNEICMETSSKSSPWSHHWDVLSVTPYIRDKGRVVCYDNGRSIASKVKMSVDRGLGGLMVWSLDTDDFRGLCAAEVGSYVDFQTRFSELAKNPELPRVLRSLNLPRSDEASTTDYYVTSNGQLSLRLPQRSKLNNYSLLRTVNAAASLSVQEKRILDALLHRDEIGGVSRFRSDYVYHPQVGYWFKEHSAPADWHTARLQCHYEGAVLASPISKHVATVLEKIGNSVLPVFPKTRLLFTGVHQTFGHGMYTSIEGIPLDRLHISKWKEQQARRGAGRCLALSSEGVQEHSCAARLPYICYRKLCDNDRISECGTIDKAYGLNSGTGQCYKLHTERAPWTRALRACAAEGGHLAVANSMTKANTLAELAGHSTGSVALGFRQWEKNNNWWTVQGNFLFKSGYAKSCPDCSQQSGKVCGALFAGKLAAVSCDVLQPFICEK